MSPDFYKKIGIASAIMMVSVFLSRVIGLFREMAIAFAGGAGGDVDAYQIAFVIPEILNHVAASGFLSITFIPIFSGYLANKDEEEGWRVFSLIMTCFGAILILFILAAVASCTETCFRNSAGAERSCNIFKSCPDDEDNSSRPVFLFFRRSFYGCPVCKGEVLCSGPGPAFI